ncbi:NAD+ synthase [Patescibacteria group bacterium]|nr:NAD+ synthase [Patescibacteria group bacterium]MBU1015825.1 NAD+ synthase [Patescibacteria group bacterium]MBU1685271.1 NAD+ synthase [Patescibacteria group bacterium]MBU1938468.1 NAD+ synthase [Patescibacteria group bacterium]
MDPRIDKITKGLKDFFDQAGFKKAVVGLSGGVDSALVAKFGVLALGKEHVTALIMPHDDINLASSLPDAIAWAEELGIEYRVVSVRDYVERYKKLPWDETELAHMNIQARVRMTILYHYANSNNALVLGTGNKTEKMLGYFTKYGDGGVDVLPIGDLYKTEVWKISDELGLPKAIIKKTASAELKAGHTDEGEIGMSYAEIDEILKKFESGGVAETENEKKLMRRIEVNRHKGELPPVIEA